MFHFFRLTTVCSVFAVLFIASCASVSPVGLIKLAGLDPLTAEPSHIAMAARLPQSLKLRTGDLVMIIQTDVKTGPDAFSEKFLLEIEDRLPSDAGTIKVEPNERLQTARIAPQDIERLKNTQARALALKEKASGAKSGSMDIKIDGGCKIQALADGDLLVNVYMKTETEGSWFPVLNNINLRDEMNAEHLAKIKDC